MPHHPSSAAAGGPLLLYARAELNDMVSPRGERWWQTQPALEAIDEAAADA